MKERSDNLVCTLCGKPWIKFMNRCECGGFCSWGYEKDGKMLSWAEYPFKNNKENDKNLKK